MDPASEKGLRRGADEALRGLLAHAPTIRRPSERNKLQPHAPSQTGTLSGIPILFGIRDWYGTCVALATMLTRRHSNRTLHRSRWLAALVAVAATGLLSCTAWARDAGDPIHMTYEEGDLAGYSDIFASDGQQPLGIVEYVQRRKGDVLEAKRIAYFADGSSDEDSAEVKIGKTLLTLRGRSIIRDASGQTTVDMRIDVTKGHVTGFYGFDKERKDFDEHGDIPPGTYFGPLINLVLKNFDANAEGGRLVFHTIVPTPGPRQIDMEVIRQDKITLHRPGHDVAAVSFMMRPTVNPILSPIVHMMAPETHFFFTPTQPPALARFEGPRNYANQAIRIE
jgi:hypothetical protein